MRIPLLVVTLAFWADTSHGVESAPVALPPSDSNQIAVHDTGVSGRLDQRAIILQYQEGNFETVIQELERFQSLNKEYAAADSLFVAKYLGVVYSVNPLTRERGKYYLYRMLEHDPGADLLDMFVSESIEAIFLRVKKEYLVQRRYRGINDLELAGSLEKQRRDTLVVRDTVVLKPKSPGGPSPSPASPAVVRKKSIFGMTGNLNGLLGLKLMDEEDWPLIHRQTALKAQFDFRHTSWPIHVAIDFLYSSSKRAHLENAEGELTADFYEGRTYEINGGIRKILDRFLTVRPFGGVGISYAMARILAPTVDADHTESAFGVWAQGGVYWELGRHFNLGLEADYSWSSILISNIEANAGGLHFGLLLGYHY